MAVPRPGEQPSGSCHPCWCPRRRGDRPSVVSSRVGQHVSPASAASSVPPPRAHRPGSAPDSARRAHRAGDPRSRRPAGSGSARRNLSSRVLSSSPSSGHDVCRCCATPRPPRRPAATRAWGGRRPVTTAVLSMPVPDADQAAPASVLRNTPLSRSRVDHLWRGRRDDEFGDGDVERQARARTCPGGPAVGTAEHPSAGGAREHQRGCRRRGGQRCHRSAVQAGGAPRVHRRCGRERRERRQHAREQDRSSTAGTPTEPPSRELWAHRARRGAAARCRRR